MLEKTETNVFIKYFGYFILGGSIIAMAVVFLTYDDFSKWLIGPAIFLGGTLNALLLFAISEVLTRLQQIEHNTKKSAGGEEEWQ